MVDRVLERSLVSARPDCFALLTGFMAAICLGDRRKRAEQTLDTRTRTLLKMLVSTYVRRLDPVSFVAVVEQSRLRLMM